MSTGSCWRLRVGSTWLAGLVWGCGAPADVPPTSDSLSVVTFNTGTTLALNHDPGISDGYGREQAQWSDDAYGNGLAWKPAIEAVAAYVGGNAVDIVGFQEIFDVDDCAGIDPSMHTGFVCDGWSPDHGSVARQVLGEDWQIACHPGKPDKCIGVHPRAGVLRGCAADDCDGALVGFEVPDCGRGARVARGVVERPSGALLTLVHVHGTSGFSADDVACRRAQVDQVFEDLGDGHRGANGDENIVLGDLNTDPGRAAAIDDSAARWLDADGGRLRFVTDVGPDAEPTYAGLANIDHILSDAWAGFCEPSQRAPVYDGVYFDHLPVRCLLRPAVP